MKTPLTMSEAKAHLGKYAKQAAAGKTFIITEHNRAVAQLSGIPDPSEGVQPILGILDGTATVPDDINEPLPEVEKDFLGE